MTETLILNFDGGSRGNPGPAAYGIVIRAGDGTPLVTIGRFIGHATNNVAEYKALIGGLHEAKRLGAERLVVRGDSQLIIRQMTGEYRVKHPDLIPLHQEAKGLAGGFKKISYEYRPREENTLADALADKAMDKRGEVDEADGSDDAGAIGARDAEPVGDPPSESGSGEMSGSRWSCSTCGCEIEVHEPPRLTSGSPGGFVCVCGSAMVRRGNASRRPSS
jgi:ribonuclease HI